MPSFASYRYWISDNALQSLRTLRPADQFTLDRVFRFPAENPHSTGLYQERDEDGRMNEVSLQGRFLVTFWADHAVRELRIVRVEKA